MKKARMNISHFRFILFNLKIFGEIVTSLLLLLGLEFGLGFGLALGLRLFWHLRQNSR